MSEKLDTADFGQMVSVAQLQHLARAALGRRNQFAIHPGTPRCSETCNRFPSDPTGIPKTLWVNFAPASAAINALFAEDFYEKIIRHMPPENFFHTGATAKASLASHLAGEPNGKTIMRCLSNQRHREAAICR